MSSHLIQALGVPFYKGNLQDACVLALKGGLVTAPSGPGLALDLTACSEYKRALANSHLVLPDSGFLCLWVKWVWREHLPRISGLVFLKFILEMIDWEKDTAFWVMPDEKQAIANGEWIAHKFGKRIEKSNVYIAPQYPKVGKLADISLLAQIEKKKPKYIFVQVGGGVQERLGLYLKENLSYLPGIFCTGAALAFLSGQQAKIPTWADSFYLGWLLRCLNNPKVFVPRYLRAFRLLFLLAKYGGKAPSLQD
jgi:N-acetylglucosaminyldiphosphoundecaprenol N-acetyl-beta-D-mannosaminyltransferase